MDIELKRIPLGGGELIIGLTKYTVVGDLEAMEASCAFEIGGRRHPICCGSSLLALLELCK